MQFATVATLFALALSVTAQPGHPPAGLSVHQNKNQCDGGKMACCINSANVHSDGILSGLLTEGLLDNILGSSDQSCAKFELIENLNLLGFTKQGENGHSCSEVTACCPDGSKSCNRID